MTSPIEWRSADPPSSVKWPHSIELDRREWFDLMEMIATYADDCEERARHGTMTPFFRLELGERARYARRLFDQVNVGLSKEHP